MKKLILLLLTLFAAECALCQEFERPSEGKALVYFVRISGAGALINFKYFDGDKYLGKMNGVNYMLYECDPGEHVFWAAAENRDYIKGDLQANSTYIVEVRPKMGALKAAVRLHPVMPGNDKALKKVRKIVGRKSPSDLKGQDVDMSFFIENGMKRFDKIKDEVKIIDSTWTF